MGVGCKRFNALSDINAYFWCTSSSTQGWWRRSRWKSKQMFKRWFKRDTIMPRDHITLWSETTFKGQCLIWICKRFRSTRTLSEAFIKKRRKKQTTRYMPKPRKYYANARNRENKGTVAIKHGECIFQKFWNCIAKTAWNEMKSEMMKDSIFQTSTSKLIRRRLTIQQWDWIYKWFAMNGVPMLVYTERSNFVLRLLDLNFDANCRAIEQYWRRYGKDCAGYKRIERCRTRQASVLCVTSKRAVLSSYTHE